MEFEQFQELIKDARKRKTVFQKQLGMLDKKNSLEAIDIGEEELYNEAIEVIKKLDFSDRFKTIRDVIDKVTLKERSGVEVWGHIILPQITEKLGYEPISRDMQVTIPTLEFKFTFQMPLPNKERVITQRDEWGRIKAAEVPNILQQLQKFT